MSESDFRPEDFSRFLIREFLKINKMDKTYDSFMAEDTRKQVVMSKSKLTNFLGLEHIMRHNAKTKTFQTMLDTITHFLTEVKLIEGGVKFPRSSSPSNKSPVKQSQQ